MSKVRLHNMFWTILALLAAAIILFPFYWIITSSLKTDAEIFQRPPTFWPQLITFEPYLSQLIGSNSVLLPARNSFIIATSAMLISFFLAVPAAYGISRFNIPGARIIIMIFLVTQMLPASVLLTPMFLTFSTLGWLNTYQAPVLAITTITIPFTMLVLRPMFMACPKELEEAARIDGCNRITAFLRVAMPIIKPGLVTVLCFGFVHGWNDIIFSLTFNNRGALFPMTTSIFNLMNEDGMFWNMIMAFGTMLIIPPVVIFIVAQRYIISGLIGGAVKG